MILTIDTFAWVELIRGGRWVRQTRGAIDGSDRCLTPSIVLAEVAAICSRDGLRESVISEQLQAIHESSEVVPIDDGIAIAGARIARELRISSRVRKIPVPGLADGLVLATARMFRSRLLTGDPHFRECPETVWLG